MLLVTHGGKFHCDEVVAYAVLRLALDLERDGVDHVLERTRDPDAIGRAAIVWDVGGRFDAEANRFDHHQRGAPVREDGTPFSAAGLVWRRHGTDAVRRALPEAERDFAPEIATEIERTLIRRIDAIDNGIGDKGDGTGLATLIGDMNPEWDSPDAEGKRAGDAAFARAAALAEGVVRRRIAVLRARMAAEAAVLAAHRRAEDPRLLLLDRGMPWKHVVHARELPVLLTVSPASNGNWMLDTVPPEPGSFEQKLPLPASWAGLPEDALRRETGVADAVFCHLRRFVAAARSRDGALAMARLALRNAAPTG